MSPGSHETQENPSQEGFVGLDNIPESIRSLDTLPRPDYADLFTARTSGATAKTAEQWARALLEESATGRSAPILWRLIGLRLGPMPSADYVQGWKIADRGDGWIRAETSSSWLTAHAVVKVDDRRVSLALFVRYDHAVAAILWPPVSALHRRGAPVMVHQAVEAHELEARASRPDSVRS
jgi:hypothetical protein